MGTGNELGLRLGGAYGSEIGFGTKARTRSCARNPTVDGDLARFRPTGTTVVMISPIRVSAIDSACTEGPADDQERHLDELKAQLAQRVTAAHTPELFEVHGRS